METCEILQSTEEIIFSFQESINQLEMQRGESIWNRNDWIIVYYEIKRWLRNDQCLKGAFELKIILCTVSRVRFIAESMDDEGASNQDRPLMTIKQKITFFYQSGKSWWFSSYIWSLISSKSQSIAQFIMGTLLFISVWIIIFTWLSSCWLLSLEYS